MEEDWFKFKKSGVAYTCNLFLKIAFHKILILSLMGFCTGCCNLRCYFGYSPLEFSGSFSLNTNKLKSPDQTIKHWGKNCGHRNISFFNNLFPGIQIGLINVKNS